MKTTTALLLVVFSFVGLRPKQTVKGAASSCDFHYEEKFASSWNELPLIRNTPDTFTAIYPLGVMAFCFRTWGEWASRSRGF